METIFIAGSIKIKNLDSKVAERIKAAAASGLRVVVGDADGADTSIQSYIASMAYANTTIYCSGEKPRNNIGSWPVKSIVTNHKPGSRAFFTAKDLKMAQDANYGLMIWDSQSTGTLSNVIELLKQKKKSVVYINKIKKFLTVSDVSQLEQLVSHMSEKAKERAEAKIKLGEKIAMLKSVTGEFDF